MCQECPAQCAAVAWQDSGVVVHEGLQRLGLRLHRSKRLIGKLSKGFDFLGYRVVPGRRLRSSAESKRRFAEKFRRLYEQGAVISDIRISS